MKKILSLVAVVGLSLTLLTGCVTNGNTSNNVAAEHALITLAASTGTEIDLQNRPQDAIYFVGAEQALGTLGTGTDQITASTVQSALNDAGVTNPIVASAITEAISLGNTFIVNSAGTNAPAALVATKAVCVDISTGIHQGLVLSGRATVHKSK